MNPSYYYVIYNNHCEIAYFDGDVWTMVGKEIDFCEHDFDEILCPVPMYGE